jgi:N-acetylmuramic acid 6-phosphate etherase
MATTQNSTTESAPKHDNLEQMPVAELTKLINAEDKTVAFAVEQALPMINAFIEVAAKRMKAGGRLFYIGAGTSGRLGIVDASECPPTFGVSPDLVVGIMAGGDGAMRKAVEFAEDDIEGAARDLAHFNCNANDILVGIAASGRTPYVLGGLQWAKARNMLTACIVCNQGSVIAQHSEYPIEIITGAEFIMGSTRMKAGTATKMVLNIISTTLMILLGKVEGNRMVNMQLSNRKLIERGTRMVMQSTQLDEEAARNMLLACGSVKKAILKHQESKKS